MAVLRGGEDGRTACCERFRSDDGLCCIRQIMRDIQFDCERILRWGWRDLQSVIFLDETENAICFDGSEIDDGAVVVGVDDCVSRFIIWLWCEGDVLHVAVGATCDREFAEIDGVAGIGWTV